MLEEAVMVEAVAGVACRTAPELQAKDRHQHLASLGWPDPPRRRQNPGAARRGQDPAQEPRTVMRYVKSGAEAMAKVTEVLAPRRRTH
ncbi:hypothetical protein [Nonomuraea fuscirosea]|uniref:hypothetical protein n=1 Tax=Nonomuraea fuscirosea TaxID=1291556 RepID=UPI003432B1AB